MSKFINLCIKKKKKITAPIQSNTTSEGAGSLVFGGSKVTSDIKKAHDTSEGSEDGGNDESEHDPHFEPIVALPDLIDVKTGEEDELVCKFYQIFLNRR